MTRNLQSWASRAAAPCAAALLGVALAGCGGSTGSALVQFSGSASGPSDATGGPLTFTSGFGADITLTSARLHLAAVYLNQSVPASGAASEPCISPGIYVAEVFGPLDVDLLSADPVPFPVAGEGTETPAKTAEVWLSGGDVNAATDATVILSVAGTAVQNAQSYPFRADLTISANRQLAVTNPALPGQSPICHQRIVTPILVDLTPTNGGLLALQIDPRAMFNAVDFSRADPVPGDPSAVQIPDTSGGAGGALFKGLTANSGVYSFSWQATPP
ncbi:MAG TPA: hypothetical protein VG963_24050 [Polyangiaceae bacterium]|nr:hypothetical protein [Polyangiaceae bacterium]